MNLLKRLKDKTPSREALSGQPHMQNVFGAALRNQEIWSFNRLSVSRGIAIGIFCAFLPMPGESLAASFMAIFMGANLPLALATVWLSNPVTWVPMYTPPYLLGAWIIGLEPIALRDISILSLGWHYVALWLGCLITGIVLSLTTRWLLDLIWRGQIRQAWRRRRRKRMLKKIRFSTGHEKK